MALGLAGIVPWSRLPVDREAHAVKYLIVIGEAESEFQRVAGRYGPLEEIAPGVSKRVSPVMMERLLEAYDFRVEAGAETFRVFTRLKRGDLARRTFFLDQTGVIRESWGPEAASAASGEVR